MLHVLLLLVLIFNCDVFNSLKNRSNDHSSRKRIITPAFFSNYQNLNQNTKKNRTESCHWLRGYSQQKKQCERRKGFAQVLATARHLTVSHCQSQFRFDQWNCSYDKNLFKSISIETAFMQSLATAALMYSTAIACSEGTLHNCYCGVPKVKYPKQNQHWKLSGCGDNTHKAKSIARKFMQLKKSKDYFGMVFNHNTNVGINAVIQHERDHCYCHGVSGSCTMKECWKRVSPFKEIAEDLKKKYYNATSVRFTNTAGKGRRIIKHPFKKTSLYFTAESPNFCEKTSGRQCLSKEHCATLCCGRGHHRQIRNVSTPCNYKFLNCCLNVTYDICHEKKEFLICK